MSFLTIEMPLGGVTWIFLLMTHYKSLLMSLLSRRVQGRIYRHFSILCQHFVSVTNEVYTLTRGCDTTGANAKGCSSDNDYNTCTTACSDDLCNSQNEMTIRNPHEYIMCYSCVYTYQSDASDTCVTNPKDQPSIRCYAPSTCFTTGQWSPCKKKNHKCVSAYYFKRSNSVMGLFI